MEIPKGVALLIRSVLNIDPKTVQEKIDDVFLNAQATLSGVQNTMKEWDQRLTSLETANKELILDNRRLISIIEGKFNDQKNDPALRAGNRNGIGGFDNHTDPE